MVKNYLTKIFIVFLVFGVGCFYIGATRYEEIVQSPPSEWTSRECLTVIVSSMVSNLTDKGSNIHVMITPYYPSVVMAINQIQKVQQHWTEEEARLNMDGLLKAGSGLYIDWEKGKLVNSRGNYYQNVAEMDSLLVAVTLKNNTWPCAVPVMTVYGKNSESGSGFYKTVPLSSLGDWPCYEPDISDIEQRVFLMNSGGDTLHPKFVFGRRNQILTTEETLFAMFHFRQGQSHFLQQSEKMSLCITGFETDMKFAMDVSKMR